MSPLILLTIGVILVATPLSVGASWFTWSLWRSDRENSLGLAVFAMTLAGTIAGVLLAIPTLLFVAGVQAPFGGLLVLVAIDLLLPSTIGVAAYLRLRR